MNSPQMRPDPQRARKVRRLIAIIEACKDGATNALAVVRRTGFRRPLVNGDLADLERLVALQRWKISDDPSDPRVLKLTSRADDVLAALREELSTLEPEYVPKPYINKIRLAFLTNRHNPS